METLVLDRLSEKREKLVKILDSVLMSSAYHHECNQLISKLGLNREKIVKAFLDYNLDMSHTNEIYKNLENKIVLHVHNLVDGSWHQQRQDCVMRFINQSNAKNIIDIGFGVPSKYVKDLVLKKKSSKLTLLDIADESIDFAQLLLDLWDKDWKNIVSLKKQDMCKADSIGAHDLYMFRDAIEHVPDPTNCLIEYVKRPPKDAKFLLSIPVGPRTPAHFMDWINDDEAIAWLNHCGLRIIANESVWVSPDVDLFAEQVGWDYHNFIVLCEKKLGFYG